MVVDADDVRHNLEDRRALYASWRQGLDRRVDEARSVLAPTAEGAASLGDDWSPERLFSDSARLADTA